MGVKYESKESILSTLGPHTEELRGMGVKRIGLFGSAARGEIHADSDLDFIVELENETFDAYMDVKEFLEDLFGRAVDLVVEGSIKPRLRPYIEKDVVYVSGFGM